MAISCEPVDLATEARCYCFPPQLQDAVAIYLLCVWANEGEEDIPKRVLGDPDAPFIFGDPTTGMMFGIP